MKCEYAREMIVDLLHDELSSEAAAKLQEHLAECPACSDYREELQETLECLGKGEEIREPVDLTALHDAIYGKQRRRFQRRRWLAWAAAGACCLLLIAFGLFASEIRYADNELIISFNGRQAESLSEKTEKTLAAYREEQMQFQKQISDELQTNIADLSELIAEYESLRNKQIAGAFQQIQIQQSQVLLAIQKDLEFLASRTENEFKRSYATMVALSELR